jgi:hypothetical protein
MVPRRRFLRGSVLVLLCLAAVQPGAALAGGGEGKAAGGAPAVDTEDSVLTVEETANFALKEAMAADMEGALMGSSPRTDGPTPYVVCPDGCGGTGTAPPVTKVLDVRPRQQYRWFWCGPAAGQVVVNWSRGLFFDALAGETLLTNWKKQSTLASWMGTNDSSGTSGSALAAALNRVDAVLKPIATWLYAYRDSGSMLELHTKIVTDVAEYEMPVVIGVAPHLPGAKYFLTSWKNTTNAHHYIVLIGYGGLIPSTALITYVDSSKGFNGGTGKYEDSFTTIWNVNDDNQGKVIW